MTNHLTNLEDLLWAMSSQWSDKVCLPTDRSTDRHVKSNIPPPICRGRVGGIIMFQHIYSMKSSTLRNKKSGVVFFHLLTFFSLIIAAADIVIYLSVVIIYGSLLKKVEVTAKRLQWTKKCAYYHFDLYKTEYASIAIKQSCSIKLHIYIIRSFGILACHVLVRADQHSGRPFN